MHTHALLRAARIVAILAVWPALVLAQPRVMPSDPIEPGLDAGGGGPRIWATVPITNLAPGVQLGTLWVEPAGTIYVWSSQTRLTELNGEVTPRRTPGDEPLPGDPGAPIGTLTNSTLLSVVDGRASVVLDAPGEFAATVYGTDAKDIYAATDLANGDVRLYHFNGQSWRLERLPAGVTGPAGSIVGQNGRMYFRAGNMILEGHGRSWSVAYTNDLLKEGTELVYLDQKHVLAPGNLGQAVMVGRTWAWNEAGESMHMDGAWGGRDNNGQLHMFATGSDPHHCGMAIWQYDENGVGTLAGQYCCCLRESGAPGSGSGLEVYGLSVHDVYAMGENQGKGELMYFNGNAWSKAVPGGDFAVPTGIGGAANGDIWLALSDRTLLHGVLREPRAQAPVVEPEHGVDGAEANPGVTVQMLGPRSYGLDFNLAQESDVALSVYSASGRHVATLDRSRRTAGAHRVYWNAQGVSPGVYFCRFVSGSGSGSARIILGR